MHTLTYISNLPFSKASGGGFGVNAATFSLLKREFGVDYIEPVSPEPNPLERYVSRGQKFFKIPRNYFFYSDDRLNRIANEVKEKITSGGDALFFHGLTPWIKYKPDKPYFAHTDACFASYVSIYNKEEKFNQKDLNRILELERDWILNANAVFFRSKWALNETARLYQISKDNLHVTGVGGFVDFPEKDKYQDDFNFVFISKEFIPKGGLICLEAFKIVQEKYPQVQLTIVGENPDLGKTEAAGVLCTGMLWKEKKKEREQFNHILANAFAHIHPTTKDTNTLVIAETSYFGCPSIAPRSFGITDQVVDGNTGFLLSIPIEVKELVSKMIWMIENRVKYLQMRKNAREFAMNNQTWEGVGNKMRLIIRNALESQ